MNSTFGTAHHVFNTTAIVANRFVLRVTTVAATPYENPSYRFPLPSACRSGFHGPRPNLQAYLVSTVPNAVSGDDQLSTSQDSEESTRSYVPNVVRSSIAHTVITALLPFQSTHALQHTMASPNRIFNHDIVSQNSQNIGKRYTH